LGYIPEENQIISSEDVRFQENPSDVFEVQRTLIEADRLRKAFKELENSENIDYVTSAKRVTAMSADRKLRRTIYGTEECRRIAREYKVDNFNYLLGTMQRKLDDGFIYVVKAVRKHRGHRKLRGSASKKYDTIHAGGGGVCREISS
jgi:hypothetical protein